jgi:cytoskeletal protein CcmA (bactofilin family)
LKNQIRSLLVVVLGILIIAPSLVSAADFRSGNNVFIPAEEVINDDLYVTGGNIIIEGVVNGDLLAVGGVVRTRGKVADDIIIAAGTLSIEGEVGGDVRAAGANVFIDASVGGDVLTTGRDIEIMGVIGKDVMATGTTIRILADVGKNLQVSALRTVIGGIVSGNAKISTGDLVVLPTGKISGEVDYDVLEVQEGAAIFGRSIQLLIRGSLPKDLVFVGSFSFFGRVIRFLMLLIVGVFLVHLAPIASDRVVGIITSKPRKSIGAGLIALIAIPICVIILIVTIVGIPLGVILLFSYLFGLLLSRVSVALYIGIKTFERLSGMKDASRLWKLFIGLLLLEILTTLPVIGWLINFTVMTLGFGSILLAFIEMYRVGREKSIL